MILLRFIFFLIILTGMTDVYAQQKTATEKNTSEKKTTRGQNPLETESLFGKQTVATPGMAALQQNILYPMNYSTGLPDIKIPIYEIKSGSLTLPVYLTYHASGVRADDISGWVGQGWQLVAEPAISCTVKGLSDASGNRNFTCHFGKDAYLNPSYRHHLMDGVFDENPDEYYFRLPGKQGMFMYVLEPKDTTLHFMSLPYENIRIQTGGNSFHITDDDGTLYKFDGGIDRSGKFWEISGWRASAMIASNKKDSLSFSYNNITRNFVQVNNDYIVVIDQFLRRQNILCTTRGYHPLDNTMPRPDEWMRCPIIYSTVGKETWTYQLDSHGRLYKDWPQPYTSDSYEKINMESHNLSEIRFANGRLLFTQDNKNKRLDKIEIKNALDETVRTIQFEYEDALSRERFFLKKLIFIGSRNRKNIYKFDYYNLYQSVAVGGRDIDYWGYYNGIHRPDTASLVPLQEIRAERDSLGKPGEALFRYDVLFKIGSTFSREPYERYMINGTLKSITYPAGSIDEFTYEANRSRLPNDSIRTVGGLRVRQIKTTIKGNIARLRTFTYGEREDGAGYSPVLNTLDYYTLVQKKYFGDPLSINYERGKEFYTYDWGNYVTARYRTFFCNPTTPITFPGGAAAMYDTVTEYNGTPDHNAGKTVYQYHINTSVKYPNMFNTNQGDCHQEWMYGQLIGKKTFSNESGHYKLKEENRYYYRTDLKEFGKIYIGEIFKTNIIRKCSNGALPYDNADEENDFLRTIVNVGTSLLTHSRNIIYDENERTSESTVDYCYDIPSLVFMTGQKEMAADSTSGITTFTYPLQYGNTRPYNDMVNRNIVSPVIKTTYRRGTGFVEVETPYSSPFANIYKPHETTVQYSETELPEKRLSYLYTPWGQIRQESKDNKETVTYLYGYNNQYIIARVANASYDQVRRVIGSEAMINEIAQYLQPTWRHWQKLEALREQLPYAQVTLYEYYPLLGVSKITDPSGLATVYDYDALGRLVRTSILHGNTKETVESFDYHYKQ